MLFKPQRVTNKMAATGTHWETVRKPGKKSKIPATNGLSKIQKKQLAENLPRIETARKLMDDFFIS